MPPKKTDASAGAAPTTVGEFDIKETKMLAAAFLSTTEPGKVDFDIFAKLTGYTKGSAQKLWPPVKRKAAELYPTCANIAGVSPGAVAGTKRKASPTEADDNDKKADGTDADADATDAGGKTQKTVKKPRVTKKKSAAKVETEDE